MIVQSVCSAPHGSILLTKMITDWISNMWTVVFVSTHRHCEHIPAAQHGVREGPRARKMQTDEVE